MTERDDWHALTSFTPARVALGRSGNALPTRRVLEFELAHAQARDAVQRPFDPHAVARALAPREAIVVSTLAEDRQAYLINPDAGRRLNEASRAKLAHGKYDAALVIADGLSATAVEAHATTLARLIVEHLSALTWAPITIVERGRVAIGDDIAKTLGAELTVVLIGERPGLTAADSVGIYLTFNPQPGITKDADRNCISNVRPLGLPLQDAALRLSWLVHEARRLRLTGVSLKEDAPDAPVSIR